MANDDTVVLAVEIPGVPRRQPRSLASARPAGGGKWHAHVYEPDEAKHWKAELRIRYERAAREMDVTLPVFVDGPVAFLVVCTFPLAKTHERKTPVPRRWKDSSHGGDWDNLGKLYSDAGNGLLFTDDGQVSAGVVLRLVGAQGEPPRTVVHVMRPERLPQQLEVLAALVQTSAVTPPAAEDPAQPELFR